MSALSRKLTVATMTGLTALAATTGCSSTDTASPPASSASSTSTPSQDPQYADGRYEATGEYGSQDSSIGVSLTLADDVITKASVDPHATDPTSLELQERFADAIPGVVVGRDIDDVQIDRLAGSSHTPEGFNAALEQIKEEAGR